MQFVAGSWAQCKGDEVCAGTFSAHPPSSAALPLSIMSTDRRGASASSASSRSSSTRCAARRALMDIRQKHERSFSHVTAMLV